MKIAKRVENLGSVLLYCHHAVIIMLGVFGIIGDPSPTVEIVVGGDVATTIWSIMFIVFGLLALGCRIANHRKWLDTTRSEAVAIIFIGAAMAMFGIFIAMSTAITHSSGVWQTALALLAASLFLPGVAAYSLAQTRRERLASSHLEEHTKGTVLRTIVEDMKNTG